MMANRNTVAAHVSEGTLTRLRAMSAVENRAPSQIMAVALKAMIDLSPGARRAMYAIDGIADAGEREFAMNAIGRAALKAYERIIDAREARHHHPMTNDPLDTDEAIEAEAVRLCRR
jgi:hypothetical protein